MLDRGLGRWGTAERGHGLRQGTHPSRDVPWGGHRAGHCGAACRSPVRPAPLAAPWPSGFLLPQSRWLFGQALGRIVMWQLQPAAGAWRGLAAEPWLPPLPCSHGAGWSGAAGAGFGVCWCLEGAVPGWSSSIAIPLPGGLGSGAGAGLRGRSCSCGLPSGACTRVGTGQGQRQSCRCQREQGLPRAGLEAPGSAGRSPADLSPGGCCLQALWT